MSPHLPNDLWELILRDCAFSSRKACRLVNTQLERLCTAQVFAHIHIATFDYSLVNLEQIIHSQLKGHVKEFTLHIDQLPQVFTRDWAALIDYRLSLEEFKQSNGWTEPSELSHAEDCYRKLARHGLSLAELESTYLQHYLPLVLEQASWHGHEEHCIRSRFKQAFAKLPKVQKANVVSATRSRGKHNDRPPWLSLRKRVLIGPDDFAADTRYICNRPLDLRSGSGRGGPLALWLLEAIGDRANVAGVTKITHVNLDGIDNFSLGVKSIPPFSHRPPAEGRPFLTTPDEVLWKTLIKGFDHLVSFKGFTKGHYLERSRNSRDDDFHNVIPKLLQCAPKLEGLHLAEFDGSLHDDRYSYNGSVYSYQLVQSLADSPPISRDIRELRLCVNLSASALMDVLRQQKGTLKALELRNMRIGTCGGEEGSWKDVLRLLPSLRLERIYLERIKIDMEDIEVSNDDERCGVFFADGVEMSTQKPVAEEWREVAGYLLHGQGLLPRLRFIPIGSGLPFHCYERNYLEGEEVRASR